MYQQFFDRFILPMFSAQTVAKTLAKKQPHVAANILRKMRSDKCVEVLQHWSIGVRTVMLNEMGDRIPKLLDAMPVEDRARLMITLNPRVVKLYSMDLDDNEVADMLEYWSENDLKTITMRVSPQTANKLVFMLEEDEQVLVLKDLKPWVQSSLMERLDAKQRARILEKMEFSASIDLFARWDARTQADVLDSISAKKRADYLNVLGPKNITEIITQWDFSKAKNVIIELDVEKQQNVFDLIPKDWQKDFFPQMSQNQQVMILNGLDTSLAIAMLDQVDQETSDDLMKRISEDQAASIRMANHMR